MEIEEDKEFELLMQRGEMFEKYNGWRTCKTCAYAMPFSNSVVCGVWHVAFSSESFCDHYKTEEEMKVELDEIKLKWKADPNSLYNRMKLKQKK
jgi:hypothetical protein